MNEQTRLGHALLTRWAQAMKRDNPQAWPSLTILARVIEAGPAAAVIVEYRMACASPEVEAVDQLVTHMARDMKVAVLAYYGEWLPEAKVAEELGWPQGRLSLQLRMAREIVAVGVSAQLRRAAV